MLREQSRKLESTQPHGACLPHIVGFRRMKTGRGRCPNPTVPTEPVCQTKSQPTTHSFKRRGGKSAASVCVCVCVVGGGSGVGRACVCVCACGVCASRTGSF